jgi:hypothetical protein
MICPSCVKAELTVTKTFSAGRAGKASETICPACGKRFSTITVAVCEIKKRGSGAYAVAQRLRRREAPGGRAEVDASGRA